MRILHSIKQFRKSINCPHHAVFYIRTSGLQSLTQHVLIVVSLLLLQLLYLVSQNLRDYD